MSSRALSPAISRAQQGPEQTLFAELYPGLRRFAASVGSHDVEPDDLVQEALLRVLERGSLADIDDPGAYLRRTIVNLASNKRRGLGRWRAALSRLTPETSNQPSYPSDMSDLESLSELDRAVLHLTHVDGYGAAAVADQLGLTENAVRLRVSRARRKLRADLASDYAASGPAREGASGSERPESDPGRDDGPGHL